MKKHGIKRHALKKQDPKKHDLKKNIYWEREKKQAGCGLLQQITGSWYDCLLLFCGALLCFFSAYWQIQELLPQMQEIAPVAFLWRPVLGAAVVLALCYGCGVLRRWWMRLLLLVPVAAIALRYYLPRRVEIEDGILYVLRMYVAQICQYYDCVILFPVGRWSEAPEAFLFWLLLLFIAVFVLAAVISKMELLLLLPSAVLIAGIAVGEPPLIVSMLTLFAGALVLRMYRTSVAERVSVRAMQLVALLCICIILGTVFSAYADDVVAGHDRMMERQLALEDAVLALPLWDLFTEDGTVTNDPPRGNGRDVLTMELSEKPTENIYLKTYGADRYESGKWYADEAAFANAASGQGMTIDEAGAQILNMPVSEGEDILHPEDARAAVDHVAIAAPKQLDYRITCSHFGKAAPLPYMSALPEGFTAKGDMAAEKPWTKRQYSGMLTLGGNSHSPLNDYLINYFITDWWTRERTWIGNLGTETEEAEDDWYSAYVWERDREWDRSGAIGEWLDEYLQMIGWQGIEEFRTYPESIQEYGNTPMVNGARMSNVSMVQAILTSIGTYKRNLDPLPAGTDPIEYFLNTSGEGYCVHFASAATLMLQTMGIPARYASGYVVFPKDFKETEGTYTAVVTDARAHAWVEVYLDGFGWVPYETTPGFSRGNEPEETDTEKENAGTDTGKADQEKQDIPDTGTDMDEDQATEEERKNPEEPDQTNKLAPANGGAGLLDAEFLGRTSGWWMGVFILLLVVYFAICLLVDGIRLYRRKQDQQIRNEISAGHSREAILLINRRMYRMLSGRVIWLGRRIRDDERFCRALRWFSAYREAAVDVEAYMKLVRQAYFSEAEMSAADAELVYGIYERCRLSRKVRLKIANTAYRQTEE